MVQKTFADSTEKFCPRCKTTKPITEFGKSQYTLHGWTVYCRRCSYERHEIWRKKNMKKAAADHRKWVAAHPRAAKDYHLRARYKLPLGGYAELLNKQDGKCACCGSKDAKGKGDFHVDHCHDTGKIRGLLCHNCNIGIGNFQHDTDRLRLAIEYLNQTSN